MDRGRAFDGKQRRATAERGDATGHRNPSGSPLRTDGGRRRDPDELSDEAFLEHVRNRLAEQGWETKSTHVTGSVHAIKAVGKAGEADLLAFVVLSRETTLAEQHIRALAGQARELGAANVQLHTRGSLTRDARNRATEAGIALVPVDRIGTAPVSRGSEPPRRQGGHPEPEAGDGGAGRDPAGGGGSEPETVRPTAGADDGPVTRRRLLAGGVGVLAAGGGWFVFFREDEDGSAAAAAVRRYFEAWDAGDQRGITAVIYEGSALQPNGQIEEESVRIREIEQVSLTEVVRTWDGNLEGAALQEEVRTWEQDIEREILDETNADRYEFVYFSVTHSEYGETEGFFLVVETEEGWKLALDYDTESPM